jgi:hypothetical protein
LRLVVTFLIRPECVVVVHTPAPVQEGRSGAEGTARLLALES